MAERERTCDVSVVVPAYNEAESLPELLDRVGGVLEEMGRTYEIWVVDDGSSDETFSVVRRVAAEKPRIHGLSFNRNYGKAAALSAGFDVACGRIVIQMDADLQDDPDELPRLIAALEEDGLDLVTGWKQDRKDSFVKNQTSKIFNAATSSMCGLRLHDFNCGLKAYRAEVLDVVRVYGEMHRYIPALAHMQGFAVGELPVRHHARRFGVTKYGANRFLNGFLDLLTVRFLNSTSSSPLHFFGRIGLLFLLVGGLIEGYFLVDWILGAALRVRPLLVGGLILILLAVQFVSLGLMAELIVAGRHPERDYRVRHRI